MGSRLQLQEELEKILESESVYFNPPASVNMDYPCIRYVLDAPSQRRANGRIYMNIPRYEVTVIDYDPESEIPDKILERFQYATIDRRYKADNLNHTVITLYH